MGKGRAINLITRLVDYIRDEVPRYVWAAAGIIIAGIVVGAMGVSSLTPSPNNPPQIQPPEVVAQPKVFQPPQRKIVAKPILPEPDLTANPAQLKPYEEALPEKIFEASAKPAKVIDPVVAARPKPPAELVVVDPSLENSWRKNAVTLAELPPGPRIAIVIDDAGVDRKRTQAAINLPAPLTIAFLTYASALPKQVAAARAAGHEIMVHMAMEPLSEAVDPGPNVLRSGSDAAETLKRLRWGLARFSGYVGVNNHMGSRFTTDPVGMNVVMRELKRRGLLFLDSRTSGSSVGASIALANDVPFTQRNIFLDNVPTVEAVNQQLRRMELFAKRNGYAVAIGHPKDATLTALSQWLAVMAEKGFVQVPISTIVAAQLSPN